MFSRAQIILDAFRRNANKDKNDELFDIESLDQSEHCWHSFGDLKEYADCLLEDE